MTAAIPTTTRGLVKVRAAFRCERCAVGGALEMSHRVAKGMGGTSTSQRSCALYNALCHSCHMWVETNPFEARRFGWKVPRHRDVIEVAVKTWRGWVTLTADGLAVATTTGGESDP